MAAEWQRVFGLSGQIAITQPAEALLRRVVEYGGRGWRARKKGPRGTYSDPRDTRPTPDAEIVETLFRTRLHGTWCRVAHTAGWRGATSSPYRMHWDGSPYTRCDRKLVPAP
jgi:hypothetical protein